MVFLMEITIKIKMDFRKLPNGNIADMLFELKLPLGLSSIPASPRLKGFWIKLGQQLSVNVPGLGGPRLLIHGDKAWKTVEDIQGRAWARYRFYSFHVVFGNLKFFKGTD